MGHRCGLPYPFNTQVKVLTCGFSQAELLLVSLACLAPVPIALVKLPSVTCVAPAECSLPPRSGASGISRSILGRSTSLAIYVVVRSLIVATRRFAVTSALAASSVPSLLLARGHRITSVPEVPLVVASSAVTEPALIKTSAAVGLLNAVGAGPDLTKTKVSRKLRAGKGKMRGRRYRQRRGPLVIYHPDEDGKALPRAFRNIPGVETCSVLALNLLQLAPGGHLGRFCVWTSAAFAALDELYGSTTEPSDRKRDFLLPSNVVANADVSRLINSAEVQAVVRPALGGSKTKRSAVQKKNPLKNKQIMLRLNPYAAAFHKKKLGQMKLKDGKPERAGELFKETVHGE